MQEEQSEIEKLQKERDEYLAGWQRAKADFVNFKREESMRLESALKFGVEQLSQELIPVLDSFNLALATTEKDSAANKGIQMIRAQLEDILRRYSVAKVEITPGDPYDPALAEVISQQEDDAPEGTVLEVIAPGYALHGKVIRPARVKVSKGHQEK